MKRLLVAVVVITVSPAAVARSLSWTDCVQMAASNNPDLRANLAQLDSTRAQEGVAASGFYPQLNTSLNYTRQTNTSWDVNQPPQIAQTTFTSAVTANENIYNGQRDIEKLRQARANTAAAEASVRMTKAQVSYGLKQAYEGYMYAKDYRKLTVDILRRRQENLRIVELRFQSGRENKGSVMLSSSNVEQARFDDLQAKDLQEVSKTQLKKVLGLDQNEDVEVYDEVPTRKWGTKYPDFVRLSEQSPDFQQSAALFEAARHNVEINRGTFLPQLALTGNYGSGGGVFFPDIPMWSLGLTVSLAILNGGKDYSNLKSAIYTRTQAENQRNSTQQSDILNLRQNYIGLVEAIEKLKVDASFREAETVRAEIARKKYNNGLLTFEDWDIIETDLIFRQKNYLQSLQNRVIAEAAWEQAAGTGVIP